MLSGAVMEAKIGNSRIGRRTIEFHPVALKHGAAAAENPRARRVELVSNFFASSRRKFDISAKIGALVGSLLLVRPFSRRI